MRTIEVRVVKRELEGYLDQLELARLAEEKADELGKKYESMAGLRCMPLTKKEVRVVKRELEGYLDQLELARLAEEKADELGKKYESMAGLRCMPLTKNDCGKNTGMKPDFTGKFLEIFDQQDELLQTAKQHRCRALRTRHFIEEVVEPLDKTRYEYFRLAFLEIFDQQDELLQTAKQHRCRALRTRHFIEEVVEPLDKTRYEYFRLAYLNGVSYQSIGQRLGVPAATIKMGITRCLQQIPAYQARRFGIL